MTSYTLSGITHLFRIKISDATGSLSKFWDEFYFNTPNSEKMNHLMNYEFDITKVSSYPFNVMSTNLGTAGGFLTGLQLASNLSLGIKTGINTDNVVYKNETEVQETLLEKAMNASFESFERLHGGFTVAQNIFSARPLQAKIGKKESIKPDDLFEVTEKVLNPKTGAVSIEHVGYIRARKVVNNSYKSNGKSKPSTFYRVATGKIRKGMELTKKKEGKWSVGASYNIGDNPLLGNYIINSEYITHWWAGMRVGLDIGYINDIKTTSVTYSGTKQKGSVSGGVGLTGVLSLKPSINLHRLSIIPMAGVYYSYIPLLESTIERQLTTKYPNIYATELGGVAGVDVGINITRTLQIHVGYRKTYSLYNIIKDDSNSFPYDLKFGDNTIIAGIRLFRL